MCGILGLIQRSSSSTMEREDFDNLFATLKHRGPNGSSTSFFQSGPWDVQLGHHRLSILDLTNGTQPMTKTNEGPLASIVFNGEIYNYKNLAQKYQLQNLKTNSDTEVLLELLFLKGPEILKELDGFFAFGYINHQTQTFILGRDAWGVKPLYYSTLSNNKGLLFASELTPFLKCKNQPKKISPLKVAQYLFSDAIGGDSAFLDGVFKLNPGSYLEITLKSEHEFKIMDLKTSQPKSKTLFLPKSRADLELETLSQNQRESQTQLGYNPIQRSQFYNHDQLILNNKTTSQSDTELWNLLLKSVEKSLVAHVPVGILLSGGIDSSLIALLTRELGLTGVPTFTLGFKEKSFNEANFAKSVARQIQGHFYLKTIDEEELLHRWEGIVESLDEPLADPSLLPTRLLCEFAAQRVRVVLGGDAGDELFGGYPTYRAHHFKKLIKHPSTFLFKGLQNFIRNKVKIGNGYQPLTWKLKRFFGRYDENNFKCHLRWMSGTDFLEIEKIFGTDMSNQILTSSSFSQYNFVLQNQNQIFDEMKFYEYLDLTGYLPNSVLTKMDRASMGVGLEARPSFLDRTLIEFAFASSSQDQFSYTKTKMQLRRLIDEKLPKEILNRPKQGFGIPLQKWLLGPLKNNIDLMLKESPLWESPSPLQREAVNVLWTEFQNKTGDHAKTFWALLVLDRWLKKNNLHL